MTDRRLLSTNRLCCAHIWRERSMTTPAGNATTFHRPPGRSGWRPPCRSASAAWSGPASFRSWAWWRRRPATPCGSRSPIGGVVALLSTYSYAKLGATFPSAGGAVHFLVKSFGDGVLAGGLNLFMWAGYIISLALYAAAFGSYAATFVTTTPSPLLVKSLAVGAVLVLTVVNAFGAQLMGRSETLIVAIKVAILVAVRRRRACGSSSPAISRPSLWPETKSILFGAGVLFIGYEGFGLVTNAARDMRDPQDDAAARALHQRDPGDRHLSRRRGDGHRQPDERANRARQGLRAGRGGQAVPGRIRLPADRHRGAVLDRVGDQRHAVRLGQRLLHDRADGELPAGLSRTRVEAADRRAAAHGRPGRGDDAGFDLSGIAMMGSAAFLLVYAAVNAGHLRVLKQTGANALDRVAVADHLPRHVRDAGRLHLAATAAGDRGAGHHRRRLVRRRMGLPALDRADDQAAGLVPTVIPKLDLRMHLLRQAASGLPQIEKRH